MSSRSAAALLGAQEPRVLVTPPRTTSEGDDAGWLSAQYGLKPDPWQALVLDSWLGRSSAGRWAAATCGLAVPRQNGKNGVLEMVELFFMAHLGLRILHTAHEVKTARKAFLRLASFFENERQYPELAALVGPNGIRRTNGQEAIVLSNGGSIEFIARSKGSGRGFTVDVLVCDEAQELGEDALEALTPTTSAAPSGDPLTIFTGTPPSPSMNGEVFTRIRTGAIRGTDPRIAWLEWSVDGDVDLDDRENWAATNPALGIRLNLDTLEAERARFSDAGFARERLGMWASEATLAVIPGSVWNALRVDADGVPAGDPAAFAVDASHERQLAIGVCVGDAKRTHVELAEMGLMPEDTSGVVAWLVERAGRHVPVVIDGMSPAASLVPALKAARVRVVVTQANDMAKACGGLFDAAHEGTVSHFGQDAVDLALAGAKKRPIGTAGGWGWDRKDPETNLAPLVAVTLARYGALTQKPRSGKATFV